MNKLPSLLTAAAAIGVLAGMADTSIAAPITYDFTAPVAGNQALGASHVYTAAGGPNVTAISGSYTHSGTGAPTAGDAFTTGGQLVGNNRGSDEMGVGVCFGNGCNNGHIDDNPEIDVSGREAVRLDISALLAGFSGFTINADSATDGEKLGVFASNAAGTALGAKLADITSTDGSVMITATTNYLFFVSDNTTTSGAASLLHSLTVTPNAVPEPASLVLLGGALFATGLLRRRVPLAVRAE
jgi:hypothetical protein